MRYDAQLSHASVINLQGHDWRDAHGSREVTVSGLLLLQAGGRPIANGRLALRCRYETYNELYDYCYRVAGTVALMSVPVMGVDPSFTVRDEQGALAGGSSLYKPSIMAVQGPLERVYRAALALGTANQLTNILRDVGEDASQRNRIYVPLEDLSAFKIREEEVCVTWFAVLHFPHPVNDISSDAGVEWHSVCGEHWAY